MRVLCDICAMLNVQCQQGTKYQHKQIKSAGVCVCVCNDSTKEKSRSRSQHLKLSQRFDTNCTFFKRAILASFETAFLQW